MDLQLPALLSANQAYGQNDAAGAPRAAEPARHLVVLTCMDARIDPLRSLGLQVGDAHILRNAGGRASDDAMRSLIVSAHLLGTREVGVIHHTRCGMEGKSDEEIAERTGVADIDYLAFGDLDESVREDVDRIRNCGQLPEGFVSWGGVYSVETGALRVVVEPD